MGSENFGGRGKEAVAADVEPEGAMVPWGVGKRCVSGRGYLETWGGVDAANDGRAVDVGGWRLFVVVAASDGRDEAESGEALMEFAVEEVFVGIDTNNEAVAVLVPLSELLEEVPAEGGSGIGEVLFGIDEEAFVLAVYRVEAVLGGIALTGVVGGYQT